MRGEFVDVGGVRLYYYAAGTRGSGDPILFIHGFATCANLWRDVLPLVPAGFRAVAVDLAAHGRSEVTGTTRYDARGHSRLLKRLLDELRVTRVNLVAHGAGCEIAVDMARDSDRVNALVLIAPAGTTERAGGVPPASSLAAQALSVPWSTPALAPLRRFLLAGYANRTLGRRSLDRHLRWFRSRERRLALQRQLRAFTEHGSEAVVLTQPLEIAVGASDPYVSAGRAANRFLAPGRGMVTALGGARHFLPEEAPETVARLLGRLVRR